jgi:glycosyltransferase involved in cell wall biosynthesis
VTPTISVVIPAYNQGRFLRAAVQSVLDQTVSPLEVIVVDDGSSDRTPDVVRTYGSAVRYLRQANAGLAAARNAGIGAARGAFIGLLDADDEWRRTFVESWHDVFAGTPGADVYYFAATPVDETGHPLPGVLGGPPLPPARLRRQLLRANFLIPSTVVMRREAVVEAGLFDPAFRHGCEDWELWLRLSMRGTFTGSERTEVRYRIHAASMSRRTAEMRIAAQQVIRKHFGPPDGSCAEWSEDKRRAYGGLYRYWLLSSVQRDDDWADAPECLRRALRCDESLAGDLDLFYALALGHRRTGGEDVVGDPIDRNAGRVRALLESVLRDPELRPLARRAWGTAYHALGLVAYNTGCYRQSRRLLTSALRHQPHLWRNRVVSGDLVKSFVRVASRVRDGHDPNQSRD